MVKKKKPGRPPKPSADVRNVQQTFLITAAAKKRYIQSAKAEGFASTAEWVRHHLDRVADQVLREKE